MMKKIVPWTLEVYGILVQALLGGPKLGYKISHTEKMASNRTTERAFNRIPYTYSFQVHLSCYKPSQEGLN